MPERKSYYWRDMTPEEIREYWQRVERNWAICITVILAGLLALTFGLRALGVVLVKP